MSSTVNRLNNEISFLKSSQDNNKTNFNSGLESMLD